MHNEPSQRSRAVAEILDRRAAKARQRCIFNKEKISGHLKLVYRLQGTEKHMVQIREQCEKRRRTSADHGLCGFSEDSSDVQSGKRLACEIDPYL